MAATLKELNTRIKHRVGTLAEWLSTQDTLLEGEMAIVEVQTAVVDEETGNIVNVPAYLMKIGDGSTSFDSLPWLSAKASDVYDWAKSQYAEDIEIGIIGGTETSPTTTTKTLGEWLKDITETNASQNTAIQELRNIVNSSTGGGSNSPQENEIIIITATQTSETTCSITQEAANILNNYNREKLLYLKVEPLGIYAIYEGRSNGKTVFSGNYSSSYLKCVLDTSALVGEIVNLGSLLTSSEIANNFRDWDEKLPTGAVVEDFIASLHGTPGGFATLDNTGKIPNSQLPTLISGDGTVTVQADMAQNDPNQPDYIRNREFYDNNFKHGYYDQKVTLWPVSVDISEFNISLYHIMNLVLDDNEIFEETVLKINGQEYELKETDIVIRSTDASFTYLEPDNLPEGLLGIGFVSTTDRLTFEYLGVTVSCTAPKEGIYLVTRQGKSIPEGCTAEVTTGELKKLNTKYLPEELILEQVIWEYSDDLVPTLCQSVATNTFMSLYRISNSINPEDFFGKIAEADQEAPFVLDEQNLYTVNDDIYVFSSLVGVYLFIITKDTAGGDFNIPKGTYAVSITSTDDRLKDSIRLLYLKDSLLNKDIKLEKVQGLLKEKLTPKQESLWEYKLNMQPDYIIPYSSYINVYLYKISENTDTQKLLDYIYVLEGKSYYKATSQDVSDEIVYYLLTAPTDYPLAMVVPADLDLSTIGLGTDIISAGTYAIESFETGQQKLLIYLTAIMTDATEVAKVIDPELASWNNLGDKPFYREKINVAWDGEITGRDYFNFYEFESSYSRCVRILNSPLNSTKDLIGGQIWGTQIDNNGNIIKAGIKLSEDILESEESLLNLGNNNWMLLIDNTTALLNISAVTSTYELLKTTSYTNIPVGLYALDYKQADLRYYVSNLYDITITKPIDIEYFPKDVALGYEKKLFTDISWRGDASDLKHCKIDIYPGYAWMDLYKVSDIYVPSSVLSRCTYLDSTGTLHNISDSDSVNNLLDLGCLYLADSLTFLSSSQPVDYRMDGVHIIIPEAGSWFGTISTRNDVNEEPHVSGGAATLIGPTELVQIDEKFIPDDFVRKSDLGDLDLSIDMTNYYTKTEIDEALSSLTSMLDEIDQLLGE